MVRFILNIILLVCFPVLPMKGASRDNSSDSLMNQLDNVISQRETYIQQKIAKLTRLRHQADVTRDLNARFDVLGDLLDEYISSTRILPIRYVSSVNKLHKHYRTLSC